MKRHHIAGALGIVTLAIFLFQPVSIPRAWGEPIKFKFILKDGTQREIPSGYYWEEGPEWKYEIAGGVAGVPKDQVESIQEVVSSRSFDPEAIARSKGDGGAALDEQKKLLRETVAKKMPQRGPGEKLSAEESLRLLKAQGQCGVEADKSKQHEPIFIVEDDDFEFIRGAGNNIALTMRVVLSSRKDLKNQNFIITLYDANGNVLERKPCELRRIEADNKTLKKIGIKRRLYAMDTTLKPDCKVSRYEITVVTR